MSDFEFVTIVLSIVLGLGITRILGGLAGVLRHRATMRSHWISIVWAVDALLWQILYWLGTVNSYRHGSPEFTVTGFGMLFALAIALYFAASLVLPDDIGPDTDLARHFEAIRRPFYLVLAGLPVLEFLDTMSHGTGSLARQGWAYGAVLALTFAGAVVGAFAVSRRVHGFLSVGLMIGIVGWLLARFYII